MPSIDVSRLLITAIASGIVGGIAMELTMWLISKKGMARGSMIVAVGGLVTKKRANAFRVGFLAHGISAIIFAAIYAYILMVLHATSLVAGILLGGSIGFVHGMLVSLTLVWIVSDRHPLEEFRGADFAIGLSHFAGHIAFGGAVGFVVALMSL